MPPRLAIGILWRSGAKYSRRRGLEIESQVERQDAGEALLVDHVIDLAIRYQGCEIVRVLYLVAQEDGKFLTAL